MYELDINMYAAHKSIYTYVHVCIPQTQTNTPEGTGRGANSAFP